MKLVAAIKRHPRRSLLVASSMLALTGFAVYWFGPQYLFIDRRVDEALPTVGALVPVSSGDPTAEPSTNGHGGGEPGPTPTGPVTLTRGEFRGLEHGASGSASLIQLPDGSTFLRLEDLDTSNGPDLRVYLSDAPAQDDWYVYDDGAYVDLGSLKGNIGSSNYEISPDVDLSRFESAVVWCARFHVGFAVAPLDPVP